MNVIAENVSSPKYFYPHVDYRSHPAFRDLNVVPYAHEAEVDTLVSAIDAEMARINTALLSSDAEADSVFNLNLAPRVVALQTLLAETVTDERTAAWLNRAFGIVIKELREQVRIAGRRRRNKVSAAKTPAGVVVAKNLERDGIHICRLDRNAHDNLLKFCAPFMQELRERAKVRPNERIVHSFELDGEVGTELARFFRREGVLEGLSSYVGSNVNFVGFALEYSYAKQGWWQGAYADIGLANSKATYMHYDQGCRDPKAIIALSDVTEENGPTGFVRGSHKRDRSAFLHFMMASLDHSFQPDATVDSSGINYRPRFANERYRREMLSLPKALHGSSHFGDDVLDGTELSQELLSNEIRMTKDVGNCIVFDGNYGIHRGGLVRSGERFVFQVVFDIAPPSSFANRMKRRLRWLALKYLRGQR